MREILRENEKQAALDAWDILYANCSRLRNGDYLGHFHEAFFTYVGAQLAQPSCCMLIN